MSGKVVIRKLPSGVQGLDELLGGGIPEFSFNLIAGTPGSGKTTLAHQIMFSLATSKNRALFFTVLGEPPLKMLRYQQQYAFFDLDKIGDSIRFVNLSAELVNGDFEKILSRINEEVESFQPALVFVDSFRSVMQSTQSNDPNDFALQQFVQMLGVQMTSWQATTFLIGEYPTQEDGSSPVFTVADGIFWMTQHIHRDAMVRKIQVVKMRGQSQRPGLHTFRITDGGVETFPRVLVPSAKAPSASIHSGDTRLTMGVPLLDEMMGGGLPAGYSLLVVGPTGSGKSVLATEFLAEGVRLGEAGVIAAFEKSPSQLLSRRLDDLVMSGRIGVIDTRALDLSIDETLFELVAMIKKMDAKRVVIDSLSGFEVALSAVFRENFRESLYRLTATLTAMGVTVLMTAELEDRYTDLRFSGYGNAFPTDGIAMMRYVELDGQFERVISIVKMRASQHSKDIRFFDIVDGRIKIASVKAPYRAILGGHPAPM